MRLAALDGERDAAHDDDAGGDEADRTTAERCMASFMAAVRERGLDVLRRFDEFA